MRGEDKQGRFPKRFTDSRLSAIVVQKIEQTINPGRIQNENITPYAHGCRSSCYSLATSITPAIAQDKLKLRLSSVNSATDQRAVALDTKFGPAIADFASFEPTWGGTLFKQGTELEAISRGNLEMSIASAQELANFYPEFSVFSAGYLHQSAAHQVAVFNDALMQPFKDKVEAELGVKLLTVMYLGRRQINLLGQGDQDACRYGGLQAAHAAV